MTRPLRTRWPHSETDANRDMTHTQQKAYVRDLARRVVEIAAAPEMEAKRQRWRDAYMLRKPDRVPLWCRPTGCRVELLPEEDLTCGRSSCWTTRCPS